MPSLSIILKVVLKIVVLTHGFAATSHAHSPVAMGSKRNLDCLPGTGRSQDLRTDLQHARSRNRSLMRNEHETTFEVVGSVREGLNRGSMLESHPPSNGGCNSHSSSPEDTSCNLVTSLFGLGFLRLFTSSLLALVVAAALLESWIISQPSDGPHKNFKVWRQFFLSVDWGHRWLLGVHALLVSMMCLLGLKAYDMQYDFPFWYVAYLPLPGYLRPFCVVFGFKSLFISSLASTALTMFSSLWQLSLLRRWIMRITFISCCVVYVDIFAQDVCLIYFAVVVLALFLHEESMQRISAAAVLHGYVAAIHFWSGFCKLNQRFLNGDIAREFMQPLVWGLRLDAAVSDQVLREVYMLTAGAICIVEIMGAIGMLTRGSRYACAVLLLYHVCAFLSLLWQLWDPTVWIWNLGLIVTLWRCSMGDDCKSDVSSQLTVEGVPAPEDVSRGPVDSSRCIDTNLGTAVVNSVPTSEAKMSEKMFNSNSSRVSEAPSVGWSFLPPSSVPFLIAALTFTWGLCNSQPFNLYSSNDFKYIVKVDRSKTSAKMSLPSTLSNMLNSQGCLDFSPWALTHDGDLVLSRAPAVVSAVEGIDGLHVIEFTGTAPMLSSGQGPHGHINRVLHCLDGQCQEAWYCASDHPECQLRNLGGSCPCQRGNERQILNLIAPAFNHCSPTDL